MPSPAADDARIAGRPFVVMNMATSIDGKTTTYERLKVRIGSGEDRRRMELLRAEADGVLIGRGTLQIDDPPLLIRDAEIAAIRERQHRPGGRHPINVLVASRLEAAWSRCRFFHENPAVKIVLTTPATDSDALRALTDKADVMVVPTGPGGQVDITQALRALWARGLEKILLEGGGTLNFSMLEASLVDEIHLTLCPFIVGGRESPSMVDGRGFPKEAVRRLQLVSCVPHESGEVFLHYRLKDSAEVQTSHTFPGGFELR